MTFNPSDYRVIISSDVRDRDGIGVEIYRGDTLLVEIFRDDTRRTREVGVFAGPITLEEMEGFIQIFRESIPWDFTADEQSGGAPK